MPNVSQFLSSWICESCKLYNDGLTNYCGACKTYKPEWLSSFAQFRIEWRRGIYFKYGVYATWQIELSLREGGKLTPQEELFAKFYNNTKILVKDMNDVELREHREQLQAIAFEAKARLVAADDEDRGRKAKNPNNQWLLTETNPDVKVSDAINVVKQRKEKMSKMDKLRKQLQDSGIDEETVNEMIRGLEQKATNPKLKTVTFQKPTTEIGVVQVVDDKPSEPFDPASLDFGK